MTSNEKFEQPSAVRKLFWVTIFLAIFVYRLYIGLYLFVTLLPPVKLAFVLSHDNHVVISLC